MKANIEEIRLELANKYPPGVLAEIFPDIPRQVSIADLVENAYRAGIKTVVKWIEDRELYGEVIIYKEGWQDEVEQWDI